MEAPLRAKLIGTGNPIVNLARSGPSQVVWVEGQPFLVDCGPGTVHQLLRAGISLASITNLLLTHHHSDHMMDYASFTLSSWHLGRPSLVVYGPKGTQDVTSLLFDRLFGIDVQFRIEHGLDAAGMALSVTDVDGGLVCQGSGWQITSIPVRHYSPMACLAYRFDAGGSSLVVSGDTAYCGELVGLAKGADVLINNCSFSQSAGRVASGMDKETWDKLVVRLRDEVCGPQEAARMASEAGVKTLVLSHLQPNPDSAYLIEECGKEFSGQVIVGEDYMEITCSAGSVNVVQTGPQLLPGEPKGSG